MKLTKTEAKKIIENYKPHKGFFNLSKKPDSLNDIEYAKILKTQNFLAERNKQKEYLKKFNPTQWEKLKEISGELQSIIFTHWGDAIFN